MCFIADFILADKNCPYLLKKLKKRIYTLGAGKSTLLNLLVGRETKGVVLNAGSIIINGENTSKTLRRKIGYVMQEDIFFSHLTVRQTLEVRKLFSKV